MRVSPNGVVDVEHLLDSGRRFAFPVGTDDEVVAGIAARCAAPYVAVVVGIAVDQLHRVIALLVDGWHGNHHRLRPQVHPEKRVGCVAVGRDDRRVRWSGDVMVVVDFVERRLELAGLRVHRELIHHRVIHHEGQPVNEAFLGDCLGLFDTGRRYALRHILLLRLGNHVVFLPAAGNECRCGSEEYDPFQKGRTPRRGVRRSRRSHLFQRVATTDCGYAA